MYDSKKNGAREYEDGLFWLEEAGLIYRLYNVSKPGIPLSAYRELSAFKVYALDCGLLRRLARLAPEVVLSGNEQYKEFRGAMAENMVLQALVPQLDGVPYYWTSGNQAEIEFFYNLYLFSIACIFFSKNQASVRCTLVPRFFLRRPLPSIPCRLYKNLH